MALPIETRPTRLSVLVRGAFLSGFSIAISMVALLITSKLFTNALDKETVGIFALLLVTSDFLIYASGLGLAASMPKLVAEANWYTRKRIIGSALACQMGLFCLIGLGIILLQFLIRNPERFTQNLSWLGVHSYLHLLPFLFIIGGLRDVVLSMLAGLDRYGYRAAGIAFASLAQVTFVYIAVWRMGGGLATLTLAMALSYGLALLILWIGLGENGIPLWDWKTYSRSVQFSMPLYINQVMNFFNQRFDTVLVSSLAGVQNAAIYEMIKRLPVIVNRVMNALLTPYLPHISRITSMNDYPAASRVLHHAVGISAFVGYGAALGLSAIQDWLIILLFNKEYLAGRSVLGLLLTAASLALQSGLMAQMLIALGRNTAVPIVNMICMFLTILGDIIVIPYFGMIGAAWVTVGASGLSFALLAVCTHRAGITVQPLQCLKPVVALLFSAIPLYYANNNLWWRFSAPLLFIVLCLTLQIITPKQLYSLVKALVSKS